MRVCGCTPGVPKATTYPISGPPCAAACDCLSLCVVGKGESRMPTFPLPSKCAAVHFRLLATAASAPLDFASLRFAHSPSRLPPLSLLSCKRHQRRYSHRLSTTSGRRRHFAIRALCCSPPLPLHARTRSHSPLIHSHTEGNVALAFWQLRVVRGYRRQESSAHLITPDIPPAVAVTTTSFITFPHVRSATESRCWALEHTSSFPLLSLVPSVSRTLPLCAASVFTHLHFSAARWTVSSSTWLGLDVFIFGCCPLTCRFRAP